MRIAFSKFFAAPLALSAAVVLGGSPEADAGFQVTFGAGGSFKTIVDGGAGDMDAGSGRIGVVSETVGGYTFAFTLTTSNTPGSGGIAFVNQGTNEIMGTGPTTVSILAEANGFTSPGTSPPDVSAVSGSTFQFLGGTTNPNASATHSYKATIDFSNTLSLPDTTTTATGTTIGSDSAMVTGVGNNTDLEDDETVTITSTPYALKLELDADITTTGMNVLDLDGTLQLQPVPEPATLAAAFTALPLIGGLYLRRRRMQRTA